MITGTDIYITRGDTQTIEVACVDVDGVAVSFSAGDTIYFTVKTSVETEDIVFQKVITTFTNGKALITITPADTKNLDFKNFAYDVQWTKADGSVYTLIKPSMFVVGSEVTYE